MFKLSVIIITLNEERNIGRCLESIKGVADEIIVADSFSADKTKEICLSHGARFLEHKFVNFAEQKNFAQSQSTYDYILSVDADEALSKELAESIQKVKSGSEFHIYKFNRLTNYCGKWIRHCGWYPDAKLRMYKKDVAHWEGSIHEELTYPAAEKIISLEGDCLHYSFYSISEHIRQADRFTTLTAQRDFEKGKRSNWLMILVAPCFKFFKSYFLSLGFLDGSYGYIVCYISAHATFLKYVKLHELWKK